MTKTKEEFEKLCKDNQIKLAEEDNLPEEETKEESKEESKE